MAEILLDIGDNKNAYSATKEVLAIITQKTNQRLFLRAALLQAQLPLSGEKR